MKKLFGMLVATGIICLGGATAFAQCEPGEKVGHFTTETGEEGTIRVTFVEEGSDLFVSRMELVDLLCLVISPIDFEEGNRSPVTNGAFGIMDPDSGISFSGMCEGNNEISGVLNLGNNCGSGQPVGVTGGSGTTGTDGGEDEQEGPGGEGPVEGPGGEGPPTPGEGNRLALRAPLGTGEPAAELLGIEVDIQTPVITLNRLAEQVKDVSVTTRLVWSGGNIPEDFEHNRANWSLVGKTGDEWDAVDMWRQSLRNHLGFEDVSEESNEEVEGNSTTWKFQVRKDSSIPSMKVPIRAAYENDGTVHSTVFNIRIENNPFAEPLARTTGPAARNVTYRRILE